MLRKTEENARGRVVVLGAGVSGLTTALCLARERYSVTVLADQFAPDITSVVAGALWEWPPAVCGHHDQVTLARSKKWCTRSYEIFSELAGDVSTGVFLRPVNFYFREAVDESSPHRAKMDELKENVRGFRHDANLIREHGINSQLGFCDAYAHLAPMVDTDCYMRWLLGEVLRAGCVVKRQRVEGPLSEECQLLLEEHCAEALINCTGLGARELCDDSMYPLRGAILRLRNDGRAMPRILQAHCVSHDVADNGPGFIFIVPRGDNTVILGGFAEPHEWELDINIDNYAPIREMYDRCTEFLPVLRGGEMDAADPQRAGLRPFRPANVRLEWEAGTRIIHNYGHGGSGVTFSWGCALDVVQQVQQLVSARA